MTRTSLNNGLERPAPITLGTARYSAEAAAGPHLVPTGVPNQLLSNAVQRGISTSRGPENMALLPVRLKGRRRSDESKSNRRKWLIIR